MTSRRAVGLRREDLQVERVAARKDSNSPVPGLSLGLSPPPFCDPTVRQESPELHRSEGLYPHVPGQVKLEIVRKAPALGRYGSSTSSPRACALRNRWRRPSTGRRRMFATTHVRLLVSA
jgi:hypothetical protein